jgi:hypothetical protein
VAVQIEGDVVASDHDAVVRAVQEIALERRVGRDRLAAGQGAGQGSRGTEDLADHREGDDQGQQG